MPRYVMPDSFWMHKTAAPAPGAVISGLRSGGKWLTQNGAARGALIGAGGGAIHGAATAPEGGGVGGAVRGALRGAAVGGAVGSAGRAFRDAKLLRPEASNLSAMGDVAKRVGTGTLNFGKRQIHGLTGAYDPRAIGYSSSVANARKAQVLKLRHDSLGAARSQHTHLKLDSDLKNLAETSALGDRNIDAGITSLPGIARGLYKAPGSTLSAMGNAAIGGGGSHFGKAMVALPLALGAHDLRKGDESATGGKTVRQKIVQAGVGAAGGVAFAGMPALAQMAAFTGADSLGQRLSRNKAQRAQHASPPLQPGNPA